MLEIPRIGLGTWKSRDDGLINAIKYAVKEAGYCHLDCAMIYQNEELIGKVLDELFKSGIKREQLWITSKLWHTFRKPELVENACRKTLSDLRLDYLDLYLVHSPQSFQTQEIGTCIVPRNEDGTVIVDNSVTIIDTWKAMEKLVEKGLVKRIGVSNFTINQLERLKFSDCKIKPYANQAEYHLYMQQEPLRDYCKKNGIHFTGYSNLGTPDSKVPDDPVLLDDPVLNAVAKEIGKSAGEVALKFLLQLDSNTSIVPKSVTPKRIYSNNHLDFDLSEDQMNRLIKRNRCHNTFNLREFMVSIYMVMVGSCLSVSLVTFVIDIDWSLVSHVPQ